MVRQFVIASIVVATLCGTAQAETQYRARGFLRAGYSDHAAGPDGWTVRGSAHERSDSIGVALYRAAEIAAAAGIDTIRVVKQKVSSQTMTRRGSGDIMAYSEATTLTFRAVRSAVDARACAMPSPEQCLTLPVARIMATYGPKLGMPAALPGASPAAPLAISTTSPYDRAMQAWQAAHPVATANIPTPLPVTSVGAPAVSWATPLPAVPSHIRTPAVPSRPTYEERLRAAQPIRGGDPKQGWTVSD